MQVGKTKDQGLYNKPSAAVHPGALAAGTRPQYSTRVSRNVCVRLSVLIYEHGDDAHLFDCNRKS